MAANHAMPDSFFRTSLPEACLSKPMLGLDLKSKAKVASFRAVQMVPFPSFRLCHSKIQVGSRRWRKDVMARNNCMRPILARISAGTHVADTSNKDQASFILDELKQACDTSEKRLRLIIDAMVQEMRNGLEREGGSSDYKMILTYVDKLPSGYTQALFLSFL
jgi:hypothetical protein